MLRKQPGCALGDSTCCRGVCSAFLLFRTLRGRLQAWAESKGDSGAVSAASRWEHEGTCEARCGGWRVVGWGPSELPQRQAGWGRKF